MQKDPKRSTFLFTHVWNATPIMVKKTSKFFPLRLSFATSRTFSSISQQASHGSVLTRANEKSSSFGLKSFFFCFASWAVNHAMIAAPLT